MTFEDYEKAEAAANAERDAAVGELDRALALSLAESARRHADGVTIANRTYWRKQREAFLAFRKSQAGGGT